MSGVRSRAFRAALFDLDGTLIDTEGQYTNFWRNVGRKFASDIPDFVIRIKGTTLSNILATYFPSKEDQKVIVEQLNTFEKTLDFRIVAGAEEFVHNLKANNVKCAVVTSSNQEKMNSAMRAIRDFLNMFDAILTAEDFSASKPNPSCYLTAARTLGEDISNCVVFEDAPNGLEAGMRANMLTIGLATWNSIDEIASFCHCTIPDFVGIDYKMIAEMLA